MDRFVSAFSVQPRLPGDVRAILSNLSAFGHGTGCLLAALLIWRLDRTNRNGIKPVLGSAVSAGLMATLLRVLSRLPRPGVLASITNAEPSISETLFHNAFQSFPSGHTAIAFALAGTLAFQFPKGRRLFYGPAS